MATTPFTDWGGLVSDRILTGVQDPTVVGILESLSGTEFIIIALVAFLVMGPEKLPDLMRRVGRIMGEVRNYTSGFQDEIRAAMNEPEPGHTGGSSTRPPPNDTAPKTPSPMSSSTPNGIESAPTEPPVPEPDITADRTDEG